MDSDVIGYGPYFVQTELSDAKFSGRLGFQNRIERYDVHAEALHPVGDLAPYAAHSENGEGLAGQFVSGVQLPVPSALLQGLCSLRDVTRQRGDQGARELAGTDAVAAGGAEIVRQIGK